MHTPIPTIEIIMLAVIVLLLIACVVLFIKAAVYSDDCARLREQLDKYENRRQSATFVAEAIDQYETRKAAEEKANKHESTVSVTRQHKH